MEIIELYATGHSQKDISRTLTRIYGAEISIARISRLINAT